MCVRPHCGQPSRGPSHGLQAVGEEGRRQFRLPCADCVGARGITYSNRRPLPIAGLYRLLQSGILIQLLQKNHPAAIGRRGGKAGAGRCVLLLTEKAALKYNSHSISLRSIQSQHTSHPLPRPEQDAGSASLPSLQCLSL